MTALLLFVFAILMFIGSLTLPVSPDKLSFELGAVALLGTAAFTAYCYGVPRMVERAASDEEERSRLQQVIAVFGLVAAIVFLVEGVATMTMTGKPSTPGSKTEPNATHALVVFFSVYLTVLLLAMLRWAKGTTRARNVAVAVIVVCIAGMIGRTVQLAPRLPEFHLGDGSGAL